MYFIPTIICYMSAQAAYQKGFDLSTTATKMALAAMSMPIVNPFFPLPKK